MPDAEIARFDYAQLPSDVGPAVREHATRINVLLAETNRGVIEIGRRLHEVRELLDWPAFQEWLRSEFDWSVTTCLSFERIAMQFGDLDERLLPMFRLDALRKLSKQQVSDAAVEEAIALADRGQFVSGVLAKSIIDRHPPKEGQFRGPPINHPSTADGSQGLRRPSSALGQLQHALDTFSERVEVWAAQASDEDLEELVDTFQRLAMQLRAARPDRHVEPSWRRKPAHA